jgi:hypothetical protein
MAKAAKKIQAVETEITRQDDDAAIAAAFDDANNHGDDDDANIDHLPDEGDDGHDGDGHADGDDGGREESDGKPLLSPEEIEAFRDNAERLRRPLSFMKCTDEGVYTVGDKDVTGARVLAAIDWLIKQRSLWIGGRPVESHGHLWTKLKGKPPPRPDTFNNRANWSKYSKNGKETDPFGNIQDILPLITGSGGVISLQASTFAVKAAIGELLTTFIESGGRRRPYIQLTSEKDTEAGESYPRLLIVGYADTNEDLSFLREMLIKDDPPYPEPEERKWTGFGND